MGQLCVILCAQTLMSAPSHQLLPMIRKCEPAAILSPPRSTLYNMMRTRRSGSAVLSALMPLRHECSILSRCALSLQPRKSVCRTLLCVGCEFDQGDEPSGREFKVMEYVGDLASCQAHCTADAACRAIEFDYNNRTYNADGSPVQQSTICILQYYKSAEIKIRWVRTTPGFVLAHSIRTIDSVCTSSIVPFEIISTLVDRLKCRTLVLLASLADLCGVPL